MHIVTKDETLWTNGREISRHAVVFRGQAHGGSEGRLDAAEQGFAIRIEEINAAAEFVRVLGQAGANNFVSTSFEFGIGSRRWVSHKKCRLAAGSQFAADDESAFHAYFFTAFAARSEPAD